MSAVGMNKRLRRKSRKLSEAEQEVVEPPKKRGRPPLSSVSSSTHEEKPSKKLVVSLQNEAIGTRFISRLQRKSTSRSSTKESPPSLSKDDTPPAKDQPLKLKFKNPKFSFSFIDTNKKRTWKGLKQIIQSEKNDKMGPDTPTYGSIEAPPPLKPPKKYSDLSGLVSHYTDPLTGLYFSNSQEFEQIHIHCLVILYKDTCC